MRNSLGTHWHPKAVPFKQHPFVVDDVDVPVLVSVCVFCVPQASVLSVAGS